MPIERSEQPETPVAEQGFTIAETLVALFVFALAGVALITMQSQSVSALSRVETHAIANLVAENRLVDALAQRAAPQLGVSNGEVMVGEESWRWQLEISATDDPTTLRLKSQAFAAGSEAEEARVTAYMVAGGAR